MTLMLRLCDENDIDVIYRMSNDPTVRENAFNSRIIPYEDHCKWYNESLLNENRIMYIVEKDKFVIGQIRLDKQENEAVISYAIEKNSRRKGYGKQILDLIKREAISNDITVLIGLVKKNNVASRKSFLGNGFIEYEEKAYFRYTYFLKDGNEIENNKNSK